MNEIKEYTEKLFEDIKHIDDRGNEYWLTKYSRISPMAKYTLFD